MCLGALAQVLPGARVAETAPRVGREMEAREWGYDTGIKVHEAGFGESVYSSTLLATPLRRHRVSGCIEGGQVLQALASAVLALVMYALDLDVNDREDVVA